MTVHLWVSSSALDTDFTAKLVDVHPANEDYPEGYDMLLNDSIIRCRYREGFDREVLLEPGVPVPVTITLPPTSNLFDTGHRIRVDISSSNWPRLDVNPNTGEPIGRPHPPGRRGADRLPRRGAALAHRPAGDPATRRDRDRVVRGAGRPVHDGQPHHSYDELRRSHRWALPARLNLGVEVADRQPRRAPAILVTDGREHHPDGQLR